MIDEILNEKELRFEEANRKLAWFCEENKELHLSPAVQEYYQLRDKFINDSVTPKERSRLDKFENSREFPQFNRNEHNMGQASTEARAARLDLEAYKMSTKAALEPTEKWPRNVAPHGDDDAVPVIISTTPTPPKNATLTVDKILKEKELRVEEANRKLAWFCEENKELHLSPAVQKYCLLRTKYINDSLTSEERLLFDKFENSNEFLQFNCNEHNMGRASREAYAARVDLEAYKMSIKAALEPTEKLPRHGATDDDDAMPGFVSSSVYNYQSSSREETEIKSLLLPRSKNWLGMKQRKRVGSEGGSPDGINKCMN